MEFTRLPILVQLFIIGTFAAVMCIFGNNIISQPHPAFTVNASWNGGFGSSLTSFGLLLVVVVICVMVVRVRVRIAIMRALSSVVTLFAFVGRTFEPLAHPLISRTPGIEGPEGAAREQPRADADTDAPTDPAADAIDSMERGLENNLA